MGETIDPIPLALFAEISARVDGGESRLMILAEKGLSERVFRHEQQRWLQEMAANAAQQRWELQQRFSAMYAKWRLGETAQVPATLTGLRSRERQPPPPGVLLQEYASPPVPLHQSAPLGQVEPSGWQPPPPAAQSSPPANAYNASQDALAPPLEASPSIAVVLSFEQLVCLAAEVDVNPENQSTALAGYGLDVHSYAEQRAALSRKFEADPALQARFDHLYQYYRGVMSSR